MKTDTYNTQGKKAGSVELPENIFAVAWNADLVHQVVTTMQGNARTPVAHTKFRGEVAGGGKKPWRQKGTGRARHGSTRSPIWVGGGITHGPRNTTIFAKDVNKKMRAKALFIALSRKMKDGQILFLDALTFDAPKAKEAQEVLSALSGVKGFEDIKTKRKNSVLIALTEKSEAVERSFSNFGNVEVEEVRNLNPVEVLQYRYVVIANPEKAVEILSSRVSKKEKVTA